MTNKAIFIIFFVAITLTNFYSFSLLEKGQILLKDHGDRVAFKNIKIKFFWIYKGWKKFYTKLF